MKTNGIVEKILATTVVGANIFGVVYFLLRSLENPEISAIFALVTLSLFVLFGSLYRLKIRGGRKRRITRAPR